MIITAFNNVATEIYGTANYGTFASTPTNTSFPLVRGNTLTSITLNGAPDTDVPNGEPFLAGYAGDGRRPRAFDLGHDDCGLRGPRLARFFTPTRDQVRGRLIEAIETLKGPPSGGPFCLRRILALPVSHSPC